MPCTDLVVCYAQLLTKLEVDEQKIPIRNPLTEELSPSILDIGWEVTAVKAVEGFCFPCMESKLNQNSHSSVF